METINNNVTQHTYLLDTCVFIDFLRGRPTVVRFVETLKQTPNKAAYSAITEAELWSGITGQRTEEEHDLLLQPFIRYDLTGALARQAGTLYRAVIAAIKDQPGTSMPLLDDCMIAATAQQHGLTVYTRNEKHFKHFVTQGVDVHFYTT